MKFSTVVVAPSSHTRSARRENQDRNPDPWPVSSRADSGLADGPRRSADGLGPFRHTSLQEPPPKKPTGQDAVKGQTQISVAVDLGESSGPGHRQKGKHRYRTEGGTTSRSTRTMSNRKSPISPTVDAAMTVVMLVDFSKVVEWFIEDVWNAIFGFADSLRRGDWVAVIGWTISGRQF